MIRAQELPVTKPNATVTKITERVTKMGRPRIHASRAAKQKAYRDRKRGA